MKGSNYSFAGKLLSLSLLGCALVFQSSAQIVTLTDNNSVAHIDVGSQLGMFDWKVQNQNELAQQWFWFRLGNTAEQSINTISAPTVVTPNARTLSTTYGNAQYNVKIDYTLSGGNVVGVGQHAVSDIGETITINNTTGAALDFHFFQYSHFDLGGDGGNTVQLGRNMRGLFNEARQSDPLVALTETVVTPGANHGEAAFFPQTLTELNDGVPTTLNDNAGAVGPGDVTWALEWDLHIAAGGSVLISKDKALDVIVTPEPSSLALISFGLIAFAAYRRRRSA